MSEKNCKRMRLYIYLLLASLLLAACNLSTDEPPPTLMPRVTDQVLPTLGYSTPVPGEENPNLPIPTPAPVGAKLYNLLNQVSADRLMQHVSVLASFESRHINSPQDSPSIGIGAAYRYLYGQFEQIWQDVQARTTEDYFTVFSHSFQAGAFGKTTNQQNIVGVINGTEPGAGAIVIGAHYDSTDMYNQSNATINAPGADDNASGVAAVVEMMRILSKERPRRTLVFVLFSAEEHDRQGSRTFVRDYIKAYQIPVALMINLDTIGSIDDKFGNTNDHQIRIFADPNSPASVHYARMLDFICDNHCTDLEVVVNERIDRDGRYGDHFSFNESGYPAVRFTEALEDTNHREGSDTVNYIEPEYLARSTRTVLTALVALVDGPKAPDEITMRSLGNGTDRLVWTPIEGANGYLLAARRPGQITYEHYFPIPQGGNALDCECFNGFAGMAIAAVSADGIMGPLSAEYRVGGN